MTDLDKLIEGVEAGSFNFGNFQPRDKFHMLRAVFGMDELGNFVSAYSGSIDAAFALKAELLGDMWALEMTYRPFGCNPHLTFVTLTTDQTGYGNGTYSRGHNESTARALLIATLKAYKLEKW